MCTAWHGYEEDLGKVPGMWHDLQLRHDERARAQNILIFGGARCAGYIFNPGWNPGEEVVLVYEIASFLFSYIRYSDRSIRRIWKRDRIDSLTWL